MDSKDNRIWKNRRFYKSFYYALAGLKTAYKEERNFRFHILAVILVVIAGFVLQVSLSDWLWLLLSISIVLITEVINSAIESVVDLATDYQKHPLAKKAKDMAAGAVLIAAIFSLIIAAVILLPKVLAWF
ncbi:diacylglycerol kinase [Ligilactobacillus ceti]|uniref:Diacylglycerol kinase n=1 Tax=Ligilactobacillus ceti DSM 22408 TaxID=1122146 RepID=A0A0R2KN27_9LACO|nr:diacylglycerol kinase family protein [Ligilactobacillus ceti]KRN88869.1 diacylglycerol kinase [Ligilactobacillus ceti DSM 22408]